MLWMTCLNIKPVSRINFTANIGIFSSNVSLCFYLCMFFFVFLLICFPHLSPHFHSIYLSIYLYYLSICLSLPLSLSPFTLSPHLSPHPFFSLFLYFYLSKFILTFITTWYPASCSICHFTHFITNINKRWRHTAYDHVNIWCTIIIIISSSSPPLVPLIPPLLLTKLASFSPHDLFPTPYSFSLLPSFPPSPTCLYLLPTHITLFPSNHIFPL